MQLIDFFDKGVEIDPERPFLIDGAGKRSYRDVQVMSHRMANAFQLAGIAPGSKVAVYSPNASRAFECVVGIIRAGAIWVPINSRNALAETVYVLNHTETEVLFYSMGFLDHVKRLLDDCPHIKRVICIDGQGLEGHTPFDAWIAGMPDRSEEVRVSDSDVVTLFCTGGTTGNPKGVMSTHLNWECRIASTVLRVPHERPVHLVAAPMTHAAGATALEMMPMGVTNVILPGFDPAGVIAAIREHRVTHLFLPPTAIYRLLAHPEVRKGDYSSLRYFIYAAAPISVDKLKEALDVFGPVMSQGYGGTELGTSTCAFSPEEHVQAKALGKERRFSSCGRPTLLTRVEIMDDEGRLLPPETPGEIVVRSNGTTVGYYKDPEETAKAFAFDWFHTGDIGFKDVDGWVYISDRKKDMIISGGFNVYPSEIEKVLLAHPAIQDCAVVGAQHEDWGEAVTAVVELKAGATADSQELEALCREKLSSYKVPKSFEIWPELPRSPVGKVLKRKIRERFWAGGGRTI